MDIDTKDREILFHLSLNARATLRELGAKTRLSKEVVHYRINNLEKRGIIEGYYAVINTYKIGRVFYRIYMKTVNMTTEIEQAFISYLRNHQKIAWVVQVDGDLDFLYVVWGHTINDFEGVYREVNDQFGKYMQEKFFSVMTNVYYFKYKYLVGKQDSTFHLTGGGIVSPHLDQLDKDLISLLSREGRMQLIEIAAKLGATAKTIQQRIRKLGDIISCFNVKVNHKLLGYTQRKVMLTLSDTSQKTIRKLISFLTAHPYTIYITIAIGQYDLEFEMMERSHEEFHTILRQIKNTFPGLVTNYFTVIFYDEPKVGEIDFEKSDAGAA